MDDEDLINVLNVTKTTAQEVSQNTEYEMGCIQYLINKIAASELQYAVEFHSCIVSSARMLAFKVLPLNFPILTLIDCRRNVGQEH